MHNVPYTTAAYVFDNRASLSQRTKKTASSTSVPFTRRASFLQFAKSLAGGMRRVGVVPRENPPSAKFHIRGIEYAHLTAESHYVGDRNCRIGPSDHHCADSTTNHRARSRIRTTLAMPADRFIARFQ